MALMQVSVRQSVRGGRDLRVECTRVSLASTRRRVTERIHSSLSEKRAGSENTQTTHTSECDTIGLSGYMLAWSLSTAGTFGKVPNFFAHGRLYVTSWSMQIVHPL